MALESMRNVPAKGILIDFDKILIRKFRLFIKPVAIKYHGIYRKKGSDIIKFDYIVRSDVKLEASKIISGVAIPKIC
jgi:hypothetical protein